MVGSSFTVNFWRLAEAESQVSLFRKAEKCLARRFAEALGLLSSDRWTTLAMPTRTADPGQPVFLFTVMGSVVLEGDVNGNLSVNESDLTALASSLIRPATRRTSTATGP